MQHPGLKSGKNGHNGNATLEERPTVEASDRGGDKKMTDDRRKELLGTIGLEPAKK
jgi:hypothetical protein